LKGGGGTTINFLEGGVGWQEKGDLKIIGAQKREGGTGKVITIAL